MYAFNLISEIHNSLNENARFECHSKHKLIVTFVNNPVVLKINCFQDDWYELFFNVEYNGDNDEYEFFSTWFNSFYWYWKYGLKDLKKFLEKINNEFINLNLS